jgi:anion-transporting  ArsA/GET3 family ATPase
LQNIVFVTGKGGVGKTFVATLLAGKLALEGKKTLLVEMGTWSFIEKALQLPFKVGFQPKNTSFGFDVALWTGEECLRDYIQYLVKVPWVSEQFLKNSWLRALIQVAPGLREISFLGKLTSGIRKHGPPMDYDCIVVDAVSSGHFVSLLKTPMGLAAVAPRGPMRAQTESIQKILDNPEQTLTMVVTNLESYSVQESFELAEQLRSVIKSSISFVANKIFPVPVSPPPAALANLDSSVAEFVNIQLELSQFQAKQREKMRSRQMELPTKQTKGVQSIWFYFEDLKEILQDTDEVNRLF